MNKKIEVRNRKIRNGLRKQKVSVQQIIWDRLKNGIKFGRTSFENPQLGDTYINMSDTKLYVYNGIKWKATS